MVIFIIITFHRVFQLPVVVAARPRRRHPPFIFLPVDERRFLQRDDPFGIPNDKAEFQQELNDVKIVDEASSNQRIGHFLFGEKRAFGAVVRLLLLSSFCLGDVTFLEYVEMMTGYSTCNKDTSQAQG